MLLALAVIALLNWIAPSTTAGSIMESQASLTANIIHRSVRNIGLALMPMYTYKKNGLWILENACLKMLAQQGLGVDKTFGLVFEKKVDARESRPLLYNGSFVLHDPSPSKLTQLTLNVLIVILLFLFY